MESSKTDKVIGWVIKNWGFVSCAVSVAITCIVAVAVLFYRVDTIAKTIEDKDTGVVAINNNITGMKSDIKWLVESRRKEMSVAIQHEIMSTNIAMSPIKITVSKESL